MAEEKPKGDPVVLTFSTGERITLPGVSSLNTDAELEAAAQNWIAKNYKGPEVTAPVVFRTPKMAEQGGFAPGEEITVRAIPTRPFEGSVLDAATTSFQDYIRANPIGLDPETMQFLAPAGGASASLANVILNPIASALDVADASTTAAISGLSQLAYNLGLGTQRPERTAASAKEAIDLAGLFAAGLAGPNVPRPAQLVREAPLPTPMQTIAQPTAPAPVVPTTLRRAQAVETPEAPVLTAEVPEVPVAPTAPKSIAVTPERAAQVLEQVIAPKTEAPTVSDFAANLNLTKFEKPEDVKTFLTDVAKASGNFEEARRGVMPIADIQKKATEVDLKTILGRDIGGTFNAEQTEAARIIIDKTADDVFKKVQDWAASGEDLAKADEALDTFMTHMAFQENLAGATTEAARTLRILRERPSSGRSLALRQLMEERAKGVPAEEILRKISTLETPEQVAAFIGKVREPNFRDKFEEYWINSLLSGPRTHIFNLASNVGVALTSPFEKLTEVGIGAALRSPDRVTMGEFKSRMAGMLEGARDGVALAKQAFVTEGVPSGKTMIEQPRAAISGTKGKIVRLPSRFLAAQDELFKAIHSRGEVAAQAYQRAAKESGGDAQKLEELYTKYLSDPTPDMMKAAKREAEYRTFQSESGRFGKWVQSGAQKFLPIRLLLPFVRGPFNLIKYGFERSPLAPVSDRWRKELRGTPRERNEALAKLTLGSSFLGTAMLAAVNGFMTGAGPSDPEERQALLATGWQPYSFVFGDTYIPFQRFEPVATPLGAIADFATLPEYMTDKELNNIAASLMFSVSSNIAEKTYLQGISNFMDAIAGNQRSVEKAEKFVTNTALGFVPNILRQTAVAIDPTLRDATTLLQQVQDRIPIIRGNDISVMGTNINLEAVPERIDIWGDVATRAPSMRVAGRPIYEQFGAAAYNLLSPVQPTSTTSDPVKKEVARLGLGLERPDKKVSLSVNMGGEKPLKFEIELTDRERRQFTFASGVMAKALVERDIASPEWQQLNDDERRKRIKDRMSMSRSQFRQLIAGRAMERYLSENDDLPKIVP